MDESLTALKMSFGECHGRTGHGSRLADRGQVRRILQCDLGCPCESMANPTQGYCTGMVAFKVDKGHCDAVSLDGLSVVATFYFPRAIHHGQGVMHPIVDERANDAQREALFYIMSGADQPVGAMFRSSRSSSKRSRIRCSRRSFSIGT